MKGESSGGGEEKAKKIHQKDTERGGGEVGKRARIREGGEEELQKGRKSVMGSM